MNKEVWISVRVSDEERQLWRRLFVQRGFKSCSAMIRADVSAGSSPNTMAGVTRKTEEIVHLKRICATLSELAVQVAANDNALDHPENQKRLHEALNHIMGLQKCR